MKIQLKRSSVLVGGNAKTPTADQLEYGELAINFHTTDPSIFMKDSQNNVIRISGAGSIGSGQVQLPIQSTSPSNPLEGNLYFDTDDNRLYVYNGSAWVRAEPLLTTIADLDITNSLDVSGTANFTSNTGFGVASPSYPIDISNSSNAYIQQTRGSSALRLGPAGDQASDGAILGTTTAGPLKVFTNGSSNVRLTVDSEGRVGIGVSDLSGYLAAADQLVIKDTSGSAGITIHSDADDSGYINFADGTLGSERNEGFIEFNQLSQYMSLGTAAAERLQITSTGIVDIKAGGTAAAPALIFEGDVNTGISHSADTLVFNTAGSARLTIGSTGDVTIANNLIVQGTTTTIDTATLLVEDKNIELGVVSNPTNITADGGGITLKSSAGDKTIQWINSTGAWTFNQSVSITGTITSTGNAEFGGSATFAGNVGIGTGAASLNNKLEVNGSQVLLANGQLKFADAANSHVGIIKNSGASGNGQLEFLTGSTPTEAMRIDSLGRVGIGCTPASGLQLKRATPELSLQPTADTQTGYITFINSASSTRGAVEYNYASDYMAFKSASSERLRIDSSGNVGIGTASASYELSFGSGSSNLVSIGTTDAALRLRAEGARSIQLYTNGENRLHINSSGQIGIGETSPGANLVVKENATSGTNHSLQQWRTAGGGFMQLRNENLGLSQPYFEFTTGTNEDIIFSPGGNVGIGTTSPGNRLTVIDRATPIALKIGENDNATAEAGLEIQARNTANTSGYNLQIVVDADEAAATFDFNGSERMRIDSDGRLLVGATDYEVNRTAAFMGTPTSNDNPGRIALLRKYSAISGNNLDSEIGRLSFADNNADGDGADIRGVIDGTSWTTTSKPTRLVFSTTADGDNSPDPRMTIKSSGNVGIGTTSPTQKLQVTDSTYSNFYIAPGFNSSTGTLLGVGGSEHIAFATNGLTNERMRIDGSGNVGIGTTSPGTGISGSAQGLSVAHSNVAFLSIENTAASGKRYTLYANDSGSLVTYDEDANAERMRIDSSGRVGIGTSSLSRMLTVDNDGESFISIRSSNTGNAGIEFGDQGDSVQSAIFHNATDNSLRFNGYNNSERMRIDSSGRLLVGATSSSGIGATLQVIGDTSAQFHRGVNSTSGASITISKSRNTAYGSYTIVQSDDLVGTVVFRADDGTDYNSTAALIGCYVDGTPGANDMPGRLVFSTTADGAASPTERMRIESDGDLRLGSESNYSFIRPWDSTTGDLVIGADQSATGVGGSGIQFRNRGTNTVRIDSSGNVGINLTPSGSAKLQLSGSMRFAGSGTATDSTNPIIYRVSGQDSLAFASGNSERLRIDSSGNVGIGTSSPSSRLTVVDSSSNTTGASGAFIDINNTDVTSGVVSGLRLKNGPSNAYKGAIYFKDTAGDARGDLVFATNDVASGATEVGLSDARMTITRTGNVGVGTTSPRAKTEIYDSSVSGAFVPTTLSTWRVLQVRNNIESNTGTAAGIALGGDGTSDTETAGIVGISSNSTGGVCELALLYASGNASKEGLRIDSSGNVGIGTTSPLSTLDVKPSSNRHVLITSSASYADNGIVATNDAGSEIALGIGGTPIQFFTGATERARIDSSGRVLIGSSSSFASVNADDLQIGDNTDSAQSGITLGSTVASSIRWRDSADAGIISYVHSDNSMRFSTSDAEAMRIDSDGVVLVKSGKLELGVENVINGFINAPESLYLNIDSNNDSTNENFVIGANRDGTSGGSELFRVQENGNVGIGTTNPQYLLQLSKAMSSSPYYIDLANTGTNTVGGGSGISFDTSATNTDVNSFRATIAGIRNSADDGSNDLVFSTTASGSNNNEPTEKMRIDSDGNVGIGTTSPRNKLDLGATGVTHLRWGTWSELGEESSHYSLVLGNNVYVDGQNTKVRNTSVDGYRAIKMRYDQGITFHTTDANVTADDALANERMRIDSDGRLLLGTTAASPLNGGSILAGDNTSTQGGVALGVKYSGNNVLNIFGSMYSTARTLIGYGVRSGTAGGTFLSTASNASFRRGALEVGYELVFSNSTAQNTAIGSEVTMTERMRIDSDGRLLVGTPTSADTGEGYTPGVQVAAQSGSLSVQSYRSDEYGGILAIQKSKSDTIGTQSLVSNDDRIGQLSFEASDGTDFEVAAQIRAFVDGSPGAGDMPGRLVFSTTADGASSPTPRMTINSSGTVLVGGESTADNDHANIDANGTLTVRRTNGTDTCISVKEGSTTSYRVYADGFVANYNVGSLAFTAYDAESAAANDSAYMSIGSFSGEARITGGHTGTGDTPLVFRTASSGTETERMRITGDGDFYFNTTVTTKTSEGFRIENGGIPSVSRGTSGTFMQFFGAANGTQIGSIVNAGGTATTYNTSSDYRLKENVVNITDGITRVKQLAPKRFNFIADANTTVDGFLAHEAQAVVPEAITGTHNEVDDDGNPVYQGIDQSKLVPLLTAALQEAIAKIESLETRIAALEL